MKKLWVIIVVAILVIVGFLWYRGNLAGYSISEGSSGVALVSSKKAKKAAPVIKSYAELLKELAPTRFQIIDQNCQMTPAGLAIKNGTEILLDNRTTQAHVVTVFNQSYNIPAYGYQVVKVSALSSDLPWTIGLNCDKTVNRVTLIVQQ